MRGCEHQRGLADSRKNEKGKREKKEREVTEKYLRESTKNRRMRNVSAMFLRSCLVTQVCMGGEKRDEGIGTGSYWWNRDFENVTT